MCLAPNHENDTAACTVTWLQLATVVCTAVANGRVIETGEEGPGGIRIVTSGRGEEDVKASARKERQ